MTSTGESRSESNHHGIVIDIAGCTSSTNYGPLCNYCPDGTVLSQDRESCLGE